jgi:hypothetical protein
LYYKIKSLKDSIDEYLCLFGGSQCQPFWQKITITQPINWYHSMQYIERLIIWHCHGKFNIVNDLLNGLFKKWKKYIFNYFNWKLYQLNVEETNKLQSIINVSNNTMYKIQRFFRAKSGIILLSGEKKLREHQLQFHMKTATITTQKLQVTSHYAEKKHEFEFQNFPVYNCDIRECISRLNTAVMQQGRLSIAPVLGNESILLEIGMDKSAQGFIESMSLAITKHSHGKYGSLITCMTTNKMKENYSNIRELALINNRQSIINQLLEFPNIIVIVKKSYNDLGVLISKQICSFTMLFTPTTQQYWNEKLKDQLINIPSPPREMLYEDRNSMYVYISTVFYFSGAYFFVT